MLWSFFSTVLTAITDTKDGKAIKIKCDPAYLHDSNYNSREEATTQWRVEEKSEVSINDKILILDSVSEEARLASKDELKGDKGDKWDKGDTGEKWEKWDKWDKGDKGDKGDKWDTWATGATWPQWATWPQGAKWDKWDAFTYDDFTEEQLEALTWPQWPKGDKGDKGDTGSQWPKWDTGDTWPQWETWPQWPTWPTGNWISSVTTSKSWKTTTVTMNYTSWEPTVFQVQDWADWQGSGDMSMSTYDPTGKMADAFDYDNMYNTPEAWQNIAIENGKISTNWIEVNVATAAWTAAKVWTTTDGDYTPTKWDFLLVNFVSGCGVDNPTLNIDWSGAKAIRTGSANANKSTFALWTTANSNIKALLYYDWTYYRCWSTTNSNTTYSAMSVSEWQTGTATSQRSMRADYLKQIIKYHAVSDTAYDSTWDWATSIAPSKNAVYDKINSIDVVIPSAATSSNQLADKDYVNDWINSVTAYYITKDAQGNQWATRAELFAATTFYSGWVVRTPTKNDYTIVLSDEQHDNATTRYIYNSGWEYQYTVNETAMTQAQLDALNSWITAAKVSTYDWYASTIAWKQATLVSGTNIKTINSNSLLGSWNLTLNDVKVSSTTPSSPTEWMVWYDTTNDVLKTYNWTSWDEAWGWGDVRVFAVPSVNDDISDMITRLSAWKWVILHETVSWTDVFYKVDYHDSTWIIYASLLSDSAARFYTINYSYLDNTVTSKTSSTASFFAPATAGTQWQVLTKTASGYEWQQPSGWEVMVSSQSWNILTSWMSIWAWTESDYQNLWTYDSNTVYLTI